MLNRNRFRNAFEKLNFNKFKIKRNSKNKTPSIYYNEQVIYLTYAGIFVGLSIFLKWLMITIPLLTIFGTASAAPEIFLIPIGLAALFLPLGWAILVAFVCSFSAFIFQSTPYVTVGVVPFILDYTLPFFIMLLLIIVKSLPIYSEDSKISIKTQQTIYLTILISIMFVLIYMVHNISGYFFYRFEFVTATNKHNFRGTLIGFVFLFNMPYVAMTYVVSLVTIISVYINIPKKFFVSWKKII